MANQVYANNMEVACKAADGKSVCAFPDVCFTPPQTPATPPGVPIPYPNTGLAADTADGSSSVKISGNEVMLKNKSYFKKSTGDEAGCAPKKGTMTSKIMGRVYFNAWSMDVKVEGENVVRHLDVTTHNHGSTPGNSPAWPYLDDMSDAEKREACGDEMDAVKVNCPNCEKGGKTHQDCPTYHADTTKNAGYRNHDCIKAKRCMLTPYQRGPTQGGCCPGQTPHHIVPKHHFKEFSGYDHKAAPCVCVEGHSWHRNDKSRFPKAKKTHPDMHERQDTFERTAIDTVKDFLANGDDTGNRTADHAMTYEEAKNAGVAAHAECFPDSDPTCSDKCMVAQIDAYHTQDGVDVENDHLVHTKPFGNKIEDPDEVELFWITVSEQAADGAWFA